MRLEMRMCNTMCIQSVKQLNWFVCFFSRIVSINISSIDCVAVFHIQLFTPIGNGLSTDYIFFLSSSSSLLNNIFVFFKWNRSYTYCDWIMSVCAMYAARTLTHEQTNSKWNVHKRLTHPTCLIQPKNKLTRLWCISVLFFCVFFSLSLCQQFILHSYQSSSEWTHAAHFIESNKQTKQKKHIRKTNPCVKYNRILFEFNWNW